MTVVLTRVPLRGWLVGVALAGLVAMPAGPGAAAECCRERIAAIERQIDEAELSDQRRGEIEHVLESARLFRDLEREEACLNMAEEARNAIDRDAIAAEIEARAARQLGRDPSGESSDPFGDVPSYRLIGRAVVDATGTPVGEVIDVVPNDDGDRLAVIQVGALLDDDKKTVALALAKFSRGDFNELHLAELTESDLRDLPEHEALPGIAPTD
jgi:hypothetical protein